MNQKYAQKIVSSEGKKDGLYWPVSPGEAPSPLGPAFSPQELARAITAIIFVSFPTKPAVLPWWLWPVSYDHTGVMSFMINGDDKVYQADLGVDSQQKAQALTTFHPDKTWQPVAP